MEQTSHLRSPGFSFKRQAGKRLPPRHERQGFVPDPTPASNPTPLLPGRLDAESRQASRREIDEQEASREARNRISLPNESSGERLWRMLGTAAMIQWSLVEYNEHAVFSFLLTQTFGNAYYPQDLVISLRRGERNLRLKPRRTTPSPSWVHSPKAAPDMRSVLFFMTELPPELIELCQGGPLEELEVRLKSREGAQTFTVSHAAISPRICG